MGDLGSIRNILKKAGAGVEAVVSKDVTTIEKVDKFILPSIGMFDSAMRSLEATRLIPIL